MRRAFASAAALLLALSCGCAPRGDGGMPQPAVAAATTSAETTASATPVEANVAQPASAVVEPAATASTPSPADSHTPAAVLDGKAADPFACATDDDCAIKDVGSCCGARPACVRQDAKVFPEDVKARCAREGRVGICGFTAIEGCQCNAGRCAPIVAGPAPGTAPPEPVR
jgi:hypothetical protein